MKLVNRNLKLIALALAASLILTSIFTVSRTELLGTRPSVMAKPAMPKAKVAPDPMLDPLRNAVKSSRGAISDLLTLAQALEIKLLNTQDQNLLLEQIQTLSEILKQDSENTWALLQMAELSFNKQIFDQAGNYFKRYLQVEPKDNDARAKYASTLIFLGQPDLAITELDQVLTAEPGMFQALAFKTIALAEKGDTTSALELSEEALKAAPNEEARTRLDSFVKSITNKDVNMPKGQDMPQPLPSLQNYFKQHEILGPKIVKLNENLEAKILEVVLKDFPIEAMPEFAKAKLVENIKGQLSSSEFKTVELYDAAQPDIKITVSLK
jgi:tetratricopeptide (TPR) repeat protein